MLCSPRYTSLARTGTALAAATALLLTGCSSDTSPSDDAAAETTEISFQLDWVKNSQFSGFYAADANGYYADQGVDVTFLDGGDVSSTASVVAGGGADIGVVSNVARFHDALETGADLVAVGAIYQDSPAGIMTLEDRPIESVADLRGLKIGTDESGTTDLDTLFRVNGEEPDYEAVRVGYDATPLFEGIIDAYYMYVTDAGNYEGINTVTFADLGFESYAGLIVTTRDYLETNPEAVQAFVSASQEGWAEVIADPQVGVDLTLSDYGQDLGLEEDSELLMLETQITLMQNDDTAANGLFALNLETIAGPMYDALLASGKTDLPEPSDVYDTSVVTEAGAE